MLGDRILTFTPCGPFLKDQLRVVCVGLEEHGENSLDELDRLLMTLGVTPVGRVMAAVRRINPATYIGSGKADEVKNALAALNGDAVIVDVDLSAQSAVRQPREGDRQARAGSRALA